MFDSWTIACDVFIWKCHDEMNDIFLNQAYKLISHKPFSQDLKLQKYNDFKIDSKTPHEAVTWKNPLALLRNFDFFYMFRFLIEKGQKTHVIFH